MNICKFDGYCNSKLHDGIKCMAIMEAYFKPKKGAVVWPGCNSLFKGTFHQFLENHLGHLRGFGIRKDLLYSQSKIILYLFNFLICH